MFELEMGMEMEMKAKSGKTFIKVEKKKSIFDLYLRKKRKVCTLLTHNHVRSHHYVYSDPKYPIISP